MREREREGGRERKTGKETERERQVIPQRPTQFATVTVLLAMKKERVRVCVNE